MTEESRGSGPKQGMAPSDAHTSERKYAHKTFQFGQEQFQQIMDALAEGVCIVDRDYNIMFRNRSLSKYMADDEGEKCYGAFFQSKDPCKVCVMDQVLESGKTMDVEFNLNNGRSYRAIYSPVEGSEQHEHTKVFIILREISEGKELQTEVMRLWHLSALGEMIASLAHELNNPLTGIINCAEMLRDESREQDQGPGFPEMIIEGAYRVAEKVRNIQEFAQKGKEKPVLEDVREILVDAFSLIEKRLTKDEVQYSLDIPADLPKIKVRRQEMQQVFFSIMNNARYALNQRFPGGSGKKQLKINGKEIDISGKKYVRITIFDRGIGIPEPLLEKVCDPFFTTKAAGEGIGLGLSISNSIVRSYGGRLWVESSKEKYTKVTVDMPV